MVVVKLVYYLSFYVTSVVTLCGFRDFLFRTLLAGGAPFCTAGLTTPVRRVGGWPTLPANANNRL